MVSNTPEHGSNWDDITYMGEVVKCLHGAEGGWMTPIIATHWKTQTSTRKQGAVLPEVYVMDIKPIRTEADHKAALAEIERLWDAKPGTPDGDRLEVLATLVDEWERKHTPILPPDVEGL